MCGNRKTPSPTLSFLCVAVDANGNDILGNVPASQSNGSGVFDRLKLCPDDCSNSNLITDASSIYTLNK